MRKGILLKKKKNKMVTKFYKIIVARCNVTVFEFVKDIAG